MPNNDSSSSLPSIAMSFAPLARRSLQRSSAPAPFTPAFATQAEWEARAAVLLRAADLVSGKWRMRINAVTMHGQSKTAHQAEIDAAAARGDYLLSERQAKAILEMRLSRLTGLEQEKLAADLKAWADIVKIAKIEPQ